ncbi:MAG: hypothetical protein ACJ8A6_06250 [Gemmatimonadales bacterium]
MNELIWYTDPAGAFPARTISGWGVRRALREGERVRRTEKNEVGSSWSGALLRGCQMSGGAGLTRCAGELDAAEMY